MYSNHHYGAYSNRTRNALTQNDGSQTGVTVPEPPEPDFDIPSSPGRASWARLIRKVFEVDPLLCKCGAEMKIIAVLTDPKVVDRIILHLQQTDPATAPRAPPPICHLLN